MYTNYQMELGGLDTNGYWHALENPANKPIGTYLKCQRIDSYANHPRKLGSYWRAQIMTDPERA